MTKEQTIDLSPPQNKILQKILRQQIPNKTVWAFGSRVEWKASETSDLDLVAHKCSGAEIADLKEALEESALHCSVDVLNWEDIPDSFRANIKKHYVVVQQNTVPEGWRVVKLGDIGTFKGGVTSIKREDYGFGTPFITYMNIYNNSRISVDKLALMNVPERDLMVRECKYGDIFFTASSETNDEVAISSVLLNNVKNLTFNGFSKRFRLNDFNVLSPEFARYLFRAKTFRRVVNTMVTGDTRFNISQESLGAIEMVIPPLPEQKAIAEVLSSLDDKIDLLRRQNKTLEDMAQTLFCKWFWGGISDGWEIKALDEIADYLNGLACQKHPPQNDKDKLPVLKIRELKNGISENSDWATSAVDDKYIINLGDIVFSWSGSLMVKLWDGEKCVLNQHLFKVSSECYPNWYIYFWTKHYISKFIQIADSKATTMGHIKREDLSSSVVKVPKPDELSAMNKKILPQFQKMVLNYKQIRALEELRDMLLSNLVSGKVRVNI